MDAKVQLVHFSHHHPLNLVQLHLNHNYEEEEEEEEEEEDFVVEDHHVGQCNMCKEGIYSFHLCYYNCKSCDYSLHNFCAEIPKILQDHPLHPNHNLTLSEKFQDPNPSFSSNQIWTCGVCNSKRQNFYNYHCSICKFNMDIICATMSQQKIDHPSHLHQLQRNFNKSVSCCNACGRKHDGTFYHCTTCYGFCIHQDCALLPTKLLIQQPTNDTFTHSHPLILTYSFPDIDQKAKFYPRCRICDTGFYIYFWIYKCDKCRYYVHIHCATSNYFQFLSPGRGRICKNFKDEDHPNLLHCPFLDESYNLLKHHFINNEEDIVVPENHDKKIKRFSDKRRHKHPLILSDTQTSLDNNSVLLHNPMRKNHHFINNEEDFVDLENHDKKIKRFSDKRRHKHPLILSDTQTSLDNNSVLLHNPLRKNHHFINKKEDFVVLENHDKKINRFSDKRRHKHPLILSDTQTSLDNNSVLPHNLMRKFHHFINNEEDFVVLENLDKKIKDFSDKCGHKHTLILLDTQTSLDNNSVLLHNPMRKIQLLCDGCVKPITKLPLYKCSEDIRHCGFVLHEWCTRLPSKIIGHSSHPLHTLLLMPKATSIVYSVFWCDICKLPSNGFGYKCQSCKYKVDVNCAFLPKEITHEAHPNHLLSIIDASSCLSETPCNACGNYLIDCTAFHCSSCNFYLDTECAFMLPKIIRHKYDNHPLSLRYDPIENHPSDYFCEICEDEFNPKSWFYHCSSCIQSMHTACAPVIFQCEQAVYTNYKRCIFQFVNVKFGGALVEIDGHEHLLTFSQGIECHGQCNHCFEKLQYMMIFECLSCKFRIHYQCARSHKDYIDIVINYPSNRLRLRTRKKEENRQIKKHTYYALP